MLQFLHFSLLKNPLLIPDLSPVKLNYYSNVCDFLQNHKFQKKKHGLDPISAIIFSTCYLAAP